MSFEINFERERETDRETDRDRERDRERERVEKAKQEDDRFAQFAYHRCTSKIIYIIIISTLHKNKLSSRYFLTYGVFNTS